MSSDYVALLDAALAHLGELKARGVQTVNVDPALLAEISRPASRAVGASRAGGARTGFAPERAHSPAANRPPSAAQAGRVFIPSTPSAGVESPAPAPGFGPVVADKAAAMAALRDRALLCQKCPHLVSSRTQVVFGVGSADSPVMFVGEAPGADEDRRGEPFVGPAGQLLTRIITAMGFSRETVYIANILKCRPDMPPGSWGNRPPRVDEMDACKPYLMRQIEIVRPSVIVALGATAVQGLLATTARMNTVRGRWHQFQGIPVMPTFHPSYLLRSEEGPDRGHGEKRKTWEDMLLVLERLEQPITEKMRGYFLKPG